MRWIKLLVIVLILFLISIKYDSNDDYKEQEKPLSPFPIPTGNFLLTLNKFINVIKDFLSNLVEKIVDYA